MGSSSNNRVAALTFWVVAVSVAIAVLGSSRFLFPGPDIGGAPSTSPGRQIVARVVAPVFGPAAVRREATPPPAPAPAETAPVNTSAGGLVLVPPATAPTAEPKPVRPVDEGAPAKARPDTARKARGAGKDEDKAAKPHRGRAVAAAKSQGRGHLEFTPSRGPKQTHLRPAKGHGKSKGRPPAHARARR
jgi:hypothetical protein